MSKGGSKKMKTLGSILVIAWFFASVLALAAKEPVIGFLMPDADRYFAEERDSYPYAARVLAKNDFGPRKYQEPQEALA
jgi:hypothetical protein